jgi:hypothetical protein
MTISPSPTNDAPLRTERRHHRRSAADRLPQAPVSSPEENSIGTSEEYSLGAHKAYRRDPTPRRKAALRAPFDRIFKRRTGFVALDRLLTLLHANKAELVRVLERPEIPLHTNGSENESAAKSPGAGSAAAPAPMPDAIAATPSSLSPRPAQSLASHFGTTSAQGSPSPAILPSHTSRISSASHIRQPDLPGLLPLVTISLTIGTHRQLDLGFRQTPPEPT